ncbi:MAG: pilus assembly protein TadG-related protein [Acidobacteria bacterium]|nr:pilus assembly protein TadG-related protein [Acidobacteriota bacterium]
MTKQFPAVMTAVDVAKSFRPSTAALSGPAQSRGQIAPMLVIVIGVLFGFAGLVLDGGRMQFEKRHMQLAADAAAVGAAHEMVAGKTGQDIIDAARDDAALNKFVHYSAPDPQDPNPPPTPDMPTNVAVNNPPLGGNHIGDANYVEVVITKEYPTTFMRVIGIEKAPVLARAVAGMENYGEGCVLALNPTARGALTLNGTPILDSGCGVQVNSNDNQALIANGGAIVDARPAGIGVYGHAVANGCSGNCFFPAPAEQAPPTRDWLAHVPEPTAPGGVTTVYDVTDPNNPISVSTAALDISNGTWNLHPGLYQGSTGNGNKVDGIRITGGTINLYPGIYFLDSGMQIAGNTIIQTVGTNGQPGGPDEGVMFYNMTTGDPTRVNAWNSISIAGTVQANLKPTTVGTYKGILFFEARNAANLNPGHSIAGTADATYDGVLYFSRNNVNYTGTSTTGGWTAIIADTITISGTTTLSNNFLLDADNETPFRTAMLVE